MRGAWRGSIVVLLCCGTVALAEPESGIWGESAVRAAEAAHDVLAAVERGDDGAVSRLASRAQPDPVEVADELFRLYAKAVRRPENSEHDADLCLRSLHAFARVTGTTQAGAGVPELVRAWTSYGPEDLEREHRLRIAALKAQGALDRSEHAALQQIVEAAVPRDEPASASVSAVHLLHVACIGHMLQGRLEEGLEAVRRARDRAHAMAWPLGLARCHAIESEMHARLGGVDDAIRVIRRELAVLRDVGENALHAERSVQLSSLLLRTEARDEAHAVLGRALSALETLDRPGELALARGLMAALELRRGHVPEALALLDRVEAAYETLGLRLGGRRIEAIERQLAEAYETLGRPRDAIRLYEHLLGYARESGDRRVLVNALLRTGSLYADLGLLDEALACLREALENAEATREPRLRAIARRRLAGVLRIAGRLDEAVARLEELLPGVEASGDRAGAGSTHLEIAKARWQQGRLEEAAAHAERARVVYDGLRMPQEIIASLALLGAIALDRDRPEEARAHLERALEIREALGGAIPLPALAQLHLPEGLHRLGEHDTARVLAREGLETMLRSQRGLGERESLGYRGFHVARLAQVGLAAAAASPDPAVAAAEAHWFLEAGRALLLSVVLGNAHQLLAYETPRPLRDEEQASRDEVARIQKELVNALYGDGPREEGRVKAAALRHALDLAHDRLGRARSRIEREARGLASIAMPRPVELETLRASLAGDEAYLAYAVGLGHLHLLLVTDGGTALLDLGTLEDLGPRIESWRELVATPDGPEGRLAEHLYDRLLRPAEALLGPRRALLVSPDGLLAHLPLAALLRRDGDALERAVERYAITYVPSATAWQLLRDTWRGTERGTGIVALGDPDYGKDTHRPRGAVALRALPGSRDEVQAIAALFPDEPRTVLLGKDAAARHLREALRGREGRWRAVHVACHGFIDPERPGLSGLILAGGEVLNAEAVSAMHVPADLAVLSACETGASGYAPGEGLLGLTRAFFHAGVPRVVVSSWSVPDRETRALMEDMYRAMAESGLSPAAALRAAQRRALATGSERSRPYAWAGFVLWGLRH